jgi:hypothetical protein
MIPLVSIMLGTKFSNFNELVCHACFPLLFSRTIWKLDVPTSVTKSAPTFCSVYVIAKGKISSFRPATYANDTGKEDLKSDLPGHNLSR